MSLFKKLNSYSNNLNPSDLSRSRSDLTKSGPSLSRHSSIKKNPEINLERIIDDPEPTRTLSKTKIEVLSGERSGGNAAEKNGASDFSEYADGFRGSKNFDGTALQQRNQFENTVDDMLLEENQRALQIMKIDSANSGSDFHHYMRKASAEFPNNDEYVQMGERSGEVPTKIPSFEVEGTNYRPSPRDASTRFRQGINP